MPRQTNRTFVALKFDVFEIYCNEIIQRPIITLFFKIQDVAQHPARNGRPVRIRYVSAAMVHHVKEIWNFRFAIHFLVNVSKVKFSFRQPDQHKSKLNLIFFMIHCPILNTEIFRYSNMQQRHPLSSG